MLQVNSEITFKQHFHEMSAYRRKVTPSLLAVPFYAKLGFTQITIEGTDEFPMYKLSQEKFSSILDKQSNELKFVVSS